MTEHDRTDPTTSDRTRAAGSLRWSLFTVGDNLEGARRRGSRPQEILDYVEESARLGYWGFFFAEHHFHPHGEVPDPWLLVAAAAERTRGTRLRLGPMVSNLSFRNPVHVAEQALLANGMSGDRVEVGLGSGNVAQEHVAFGLYPDSVTRKRAAFDSAVPTFLSVLSGEGAPAPGLPSGRVRVEIGPAISPASRVWFAVGTPEAAIRFGSKGHSVAVGPPFATMSGLPQLTDIVAKIREGLRGHAAVRVAAAFPTYVGPEPDAAISALDDFLEVKHRDGNLHLDSSHTPVSRSTSARELVRQGLALIGRPDDVREQIARVAATGLTDVFAMPDLGGVAPALVLPSLRELAKLARSPAPPISG